MDHACLHSQHGEADVLILGLQELHGGMHSVEVPSTSLF